MCPAANSIHHHSLRSTIQSVVYPAEYTPVQTMDSLYPCQPWALEIALIKYGSDTKDLWISDGKALLTPMHSSLYCVLQSPDFPMLAALRLPGSSFTPAPVEGEVRVLQHRQTRSPAYRAFQVTSYMHVLQSEVDPKPHWRNLPVSPQLGKVSCKMEKNTTDGSAGSWFP